MMMYLLLYYTMSDFECILMKKKKTREYIKDTKK